MTDHHILWKTIISGSVFFLVLLMLICLISCKKDTEPAQQHAEQESEKSSVRERSPWTDEGSLKAMIISDLHYTGYKEVDHLSVPGMAVSEEITDAIIKEVISVHPDVFIMTGDNTNSGYSGDVEALVSKLQTVKDSGIPVIVTTGNHDFDLMNEEEYEKAYFGLLEPLDRDAASLSYTAMIKDVVFLAMDDKDLKLGAQGKFSPETLQWLRDMLLKYKDHRIIFLSHHNVLYGAGENSTNSNLIHNPELAGLLREGGVRLAITGHMHSQYILEEEGLWEILSGMPFSGKHLMGNLAIGSDSLLYCAEPVDFSEYGDSVKEKLYELELESQNFMDKTLSELLEKEGVTGLKKGNILNLINKFFRYYEEGSLAEHRAELTKDPVYDDMLKALWNHNYGPWMKSMIETTKYSGRELELELKLQS